MTISLSDAGKRFNREWIFRRLNYTFSSGSSYAIIGPNGSGKSTLLQALGGSIMLNEGTIQFSANGTNCPTEQIFNHVSICAPYLELVEEMTAGEFLRFHNAFKSFLPGITVDSAIEKVGLASAVNKQIRYYSSGMKQRVKLAQCIFSDTAIVLLDEPCTNLDAAGIDLYHYLVKSFCHNRLVVVSSNDEVEYRFCSQRLEMGDYKQN
jgi:ABC-type multidrug transport system ATPase subunit